MPVDQASQHVLAFLAALSSVLWSEPLYGSAYGPGETTSLWGKLVRRGANPTRPGTVALGANSHPDVVLGIVATPPGGKPHEFNVSVMHDGQQWQIETWVWRELWPDSEGYETLRSFPHRRATTLDECIVQLRAAIADLSTCDDLLEPPDER